jgi:hypothetical protein
LLFLGIFGAEAVALNGGGNAVLHQSIDHGRCHGVVDVDVDVEDASAVNAGNLTVGTPRYSRAKSAP